MKKEGSLFFFSSYVGRESVCDGLMDTVLPLT